MKVCLNSCRVSYIILFLFILNVTQARVDPNSRFIHFESEQGMANINISHLYQDSYGFLWIASNYGLHYFNGYEFKTFLSNPDDSTSLNTNFNSYIWEDEQHKIWIHNFYRGLSYYDHTSEKFTHFLLDKRIHSAIIDDQDDVLLALANKEGIGNFNSQTKQFEVIITSPIQGCFNSSYFNDVIRDKYGNIWFSGDHLYHYDTISTKVACFTKEGGDISNNYVSTFFIDSKENLWVGTAKGINLWNDQEEVFKQIIPSSYPEIRALNNLDLDYIFCFVEDKDGNFWIGTGGGLLYYDITNDYFQVFQYEENNPNSIREGIVTTLAFDNSDILWLGSENGLSMLPPTAGQFDSQLNNAIVGKQLNPRVVRQVIQTDSSEYWLAHSEGLYHINRQDGKYVRKRISDQMMFGLYAGRNRDIYAGIISDGFIQVNNDAVINHFPMGYPNDGSLLLGNPVFDFVEDMTGTLWIAAGGELNRYDPDTGRFLHMSNFTSDTTRHLGLTRVYDLMIDQQENLWLASQNGLYYLPRFELTKEIGERLNFTTFQHDINDPYSINNNVTTTLLESADGTIWVGTETGLNRYENGRFIRYSWAEKGSLVLSIVEDNQQNLWLGTINGLVHFNRQEDTFTTYTTRDGLPANNFKLKNGFRNVDGQMVFATELGIINFHPDNLYKNRDTPPILITDFKLFNQSISPKKDSTLLNMPIYLTENITLQHWQNVLTVQFTALNFLNSQENQYAYQLIGFDDTLQHIGNRREVTFTNLDPGTYTLWVQGSNNDGVWNTEGTKLHINILPPWWQTRWAMLFWGILLISILYTIYKFQLGRQLDRAEAVRLQELDTFKNRLYTNITHEFRTPLTIILGMVQQIRTKPVEQLTNGLNMIQRNGKHLLQLIEQMLSLNKLETGNLVIQKTQGDVILFLKYIIEPFIALAASQSIELRVVVGTEALIMDYDTEKLKSIVSNLLSNAIKFTPSDGKIVVEIKEIQQQLSITVSDTGIGIPANKLGKVFERFYQIDDHSTRQSEGTGIGLALTKGLVELLDGNIQVYSKIGKGTVFTVLLPIQQMAPIATNLPLSLEKISPPTAIQSATFLENDNEFPLLLIVEDNQDVAYYLTTCLEEKYNLIFANDGQEGIEKALKHIPDLIVSDVMMPNKDGFELCEALKKDILTSHIPIILLTAKADIQSKLEGLKYGADAYLAKPFNERELEVRLENLFNLREKLRTYYTSSQFVHSTKNNGLSTKHSSQETIFLKQLIECIHQEIDNTELTAELLAEQMNMSYSNLYRKLKALSDMSVSEYIRHIRIQKAAQLLLNRLDLNISQVAIEVGFSTLAHFSREFKKQYKESPSRFRKS